MGFMDFAKDLHSKFQEKSEEIRDEKSSLECESDEELKRIAKDCRGTVRGRVAYAILQERGAN